MRKAKSFSHIGNHAVHVLARLAARNIVKDQLRNQGVRLSLVPIRDIHAQAQEYLRQHPELYVVARERALRMGMIELTKQITQSRALKRLNFFLQLLRFSGSGAY